MGREGGVGGREEGGGGGAGDRWMSGLAEGATLRAVSALLLLLLSVPLIQHTTAIVANTNPSVPAGSPALPIVTPTATCTNVAAAAAALACISRLLLPLHSA